ncbi:hypothetical protein GGR51DRAFT_559418 [Nemania sp. FL0031]|nr:hypothetical protein GGR51DRAFT_559418 [Nemania sp. FL0031]
MPPKRKPLSLEISSDSDSDVVVLQRPTATTVLPEVMRNIETLKAKREAGRKKISASFDAYITRRMKEIEDYYSSETQKRWVDLTMRHVPSSAYKTSWLASEAKALLTRYAEALEQRAAIEKSIEDLALDARDELQQLMTVLEAAYTGRQRQFKAAVGSFASLEPVMLKSPAPDKGAVDIQGEDQADEAGKSHARETKRQNEDQGREYIFDRILW